MRFSKPSKLLSPFVKQYWAIDSNIEAENEYVHRIIPHGLMELMFYQKSRPCIEKEGKSFSENIVLTGQQADFYDMRIQNSLSIFSVTFKPHGPMMFFNLPLHEICNQNIPLRYLCKQNIEDVENKINQVNSFEEKTQIVESFLTELLFRNYNKFEIGRIKSTVDKINEAKAEISIEDLSSHACLSKKQFERTFMKYVGISPKRFLKIVRFQHSLYLWQKTDKMRLTDLAYECGYFDQSHMIADFKKLSGMTPKKFFNDCESHSDYFQ